VESKRCVTQYFRWAKPRCSAKPLTRTKPPSLPHLDHGHPQRDPRKQPVFQLLFMVGKVLNGPGMLAVQVVEILKEQTGHTHMVSHFSIGSQNLVNNQKTTSGCQNPEPQIIIFHGSKPLTLIEKQIVSAQELPANRNA
jgi:hypothetical protein